jgi:hypothetical protein
MVRSIFDQREACDTAAGARGGEGQANGPGERITDCDVDTGCLGLTARVRSRTGG